VPRTESERPIRSRRDFIRRFMPRRYHSEFALGQGPALGAEVPSTPEPGSLGAAAVLVSMLAMLHRRARRQDPRRYTS